MLVGALFLTALDVSGQNTIAELKARQKELEKEIEENQKLLKLTEKKRKRTVNQIYLIRKQIRNREALIEEYEKEIKTIGQNIKLRQKEIDSMERRIGELQKEYEEIIRKYYELKKRKGGITAYIFASEDLDQAYKRMRYYQQFLNYGKELYKKLNGTKKKMEDEKEKMVQERLEREATVKKLKEEQLRLIREKDRKNRYVQNLQKKEKEIRQEIRKKKRIKARLKDTMEKILAEERRKRKNGIDLTPEEKVISGNFSKNKGKLPWPVEKGVVIEGFGVHRHPVLRNITVRNDGIDIMTERGSKARAVFEGEVRKIIAIPGANETVIIRHGNYYTVYQNVYKVSVKAGEHVKMKQPIGTVFTDSKSGETVLHFEIWSGMKKMDPEKWLAGEK